MERERQLVEQAMSQEEEYRRQASDRVGSPPSVTQSDIPLWVTKKTSAEVGTETWGTPTRASAVQTDYGELRTAISAISSASASRRTTRVPVTACKLIPTLK